METYVFWGAIGLLALFLIVGLICGLTRGLKRSSLHLIFFLASVLLAFFITKPITNAILNVNITINGQAQTISEYIISLVQEQFDLSNFGTAQAFLEKLPNAIVSPILFLVISYVCYALFDIIYLIVARVSFGKKKADFEKHKPYRAYGAIIGMFEGFLVLFLTFAPITALTQTYAEIVATSSEVHSAAVVDQPQLQQTVGERLDALLPAQVKEIITAYNKSVVGKIAGAGGIDNALFDGLSNFKLDGEKIEFRKDLVSMAKTYDQVVVTINNITLEKFDQLDFETLKTNLEKFMNQGLFKKVVSDTVNDIVVKFDDIKTSLNLQDLPTIVQDIINDLQAKFSAENFDTYEYLKHDLLKIVDVAEGLYKNNLIGKFNVQDATVTTYLDIIDENEILAKQVLSNALSLNLVKDSARAVSKFLSEKLTTMFENPDNLELGVNLDYTNGEELTEQIFVALNKFVALNDKIELSEILNSSDIVSTLTNIPNLGEVLTQAGDTFDSVRDLSVFVLPVQSGVRDQKVYVLDNILKTFGVSLLGDEVEISGGKTTLDTYSKFFEFIKPAIVSAKEMGLTDFGKEGVTFDSILDKILIELKTDSNKLSETLMPFYQLEKASFSKDSNLKTLIFDNVKDALVSGTDGFLDVSKIQDTTAGWTYELNLLGEILNKLNTGKVGTENKTYLKAMLDGTTSLEDIMKAMGKDENQNLIAEVLDPLFESNMITDTLTTNMFTLLEDAVEAITTKRPTIPTAQLKNADSRAKDVATLAELFKNYETLKMLAGDGSEITEEEQIKYIISLGKILDSLKVNAYNGGAEKGTFDDVFTNLVWHYVGKDITVDQKYGGDIAIERLGLFYYIIKANVEGEIDFYTVNYQSAMQDLVEIGLLSRNINNSVKDITLSDETLAQYATAFKNGLGLTEENRDEKLATINKLNAVIAEGYQFKVLSAEQKEQYGAKLAMAIDSAFSEDAEIAQALKTLLQIETPAV